MSYIVQHGEYVVVVQQGSDGAWYGRCEHRAHEPYGWTSLAGTSTDAAIYADAHIDRHLFGGYRDEAIPADAPVEIVTDADTAKLLGGAE